MSGTVNPQERLAVVLDAATWNVVINLLSIAPQSLIAEITRQCLQQGQPAADSGAALAASRGNGEARVE